MNISTLFSLRRSVVSCAVAFLSLGVVRAENSTIEVGQQPLGIFPVGNVVHVFHGQIDLNFDGVQDEGDSPASWWVLNPSTRQVLSKKDLEWGGIGFPFRPYLDTETKLLYFSHLGRIRSFSLETQEMVQDTVASYAATAVAAHGDIVYASVRISYTDPGFLVRYNTKTKEEEQATVGVNPQQIVWFTTADSQEGVLVLCEGGFGAGSAPSTLYKQFADGTLVETPLELGGTGNHVLVHDNYAFVTMNGSSEVKVVDIANWEVVRTIDVPTEPGNGPRETAVLGGDIVVSTYEGDVRRYSATTGALRTAFKTTGKPEGLAIVGNTVWIANAYESGSFSASNIIDVWDISVTSVAEVPYTNAHVAVAPSVLSDEAEVRVPAALFSGEVQGTVVSPTGAELAHIPFSSLGADGYRAQLVASRLGLASGRYFLRIVGNGNATVVPFVVIR